MIQLKNKLLVDDKTGEVYSSDISPKFQGLSFEDYKSTFKKDKSIRFLNPMKAEELLGDKLEEVLSNKLTVAEQKWDGHRALIYTSTTANRIFSRNISKQSKWFSENSDQMPHIRDIVQLNMNGCVIDGEITLPIKNCTCRDVQSVTGALPETALKNQLEKGFAEFNAYDLLYYKGINIQHMPYWKRKIYLWKVIREFNVPFIKMCVIYAVRETATGLKKLWEEYDPEVYMSGLVGCIQEVSGYRELYKEMINNGDEGIILKDITKQYEQKRSKNFVKMKGHNTYDCVIMGFEDPVRAVDLSERKTKEEDWLYWEHLEGDLVVSGKPKLWDREECCPVTKFHAMGWIGAIHIGVWKERHLQYFLNKFDNNLDEAKEFIENCIKKGTIREGDKHYWELIKVGRCAGLDDKTREEISMNEEKYLGAVVEVEAQKIINNETGSLQHPRFTCFRIDKNSEECTFNAHIRKYGEDK